LAIRKNYKSKFSNELDKKIQNTINKKPSIEGGKKIQYHKILQHSISTNRKKLIPSDIDTIQSIIYDRWSENIDLDLEKMNLSYKIFLEIKEDKKLFNLLERQSNQLWQSSSNPKECGINFKDFIENNDNQIEGEPWWNWVIWILIALFILFGTW